MVKRLKCVHVPYTIPDCDIEYVNMVLNSVSPHSIYRKRFDKNIVTTYSRRARIVWFNHVASCSPIVLVDYANSGNVYYFYKTSAPYLHTFVTYIIPNAHRDLLRCSSNCTCCPHRELVVDVGHTFLDFFTLVVVHASVIHQRTKSNGSGGTTKRQRIDFVLWEGKGMECNDEFKASFERSICLPMTCPPDQSHTTVILDMNDPGRMLFDRRIRYSVDTRPPSTSTSTNVAPAAATTTTTPAWWTSTRSLLGGRFTPSEMVAIGKVFTTERPAFEFKAFAAMDPDSATASVEPAATEDGGSCDGSGGGGSGGGSSSATTPPPPRLLPYTTYASPPRIVQETLGFLLLNFELDWVKSVTERISAVNRSDSWQVVQNAIEDVLRQLESGRGEGAEGGGRVRIPTLPDYEDEGEPFLLGAMPILQAWSCGWWALQRIGPTAVLTNEVTERMDPRKQRPVDGGDEDAFFSTVESGRLRGTHVDLVVLEIVVAEKLSATMVRVLSAWNRERPSATVILKFRSSSAAFATSATQRCCPDIANLAIHVDEMSAHFVTALDECFGFAPAESLQIHAKFWRLDSADHLTLFSNGPRQLTLSTPFVKPVANFLATVSPACNHVLLPQFGLRTVPPTDFARLTASKTGSNSFARLDLGECKHPMRPEVMEAVCQVASECVVIEHRFSNTAPAPLTLAAAAPTAAPAGAPDTAQAPYV
ncbi:hypothetical protein V5799_021218, partial [Amblyomma americanum]